MRIEIADYKNEIHLNAGERYVDDRVLSVRLDELDDDELVGLTLKLVEKKLRLMLAGMRAPKPLEVVDDSGATPAAGAA